MAAVPIQGPQPQLQGAHTEREDDLCKVDGNLWKCIGRKVFSSGRQYMFQISREIRGTDQEDKLSIEKFPAIEEVANKIPSLLEAHSASFTQLGIAYDSETETLTLPDKAAFDGAWSSFCTENHSLNLPALSIGSCEGKASDEAYLSLISEHDWVLSTGEEFVHDWLIHAIPTLTVVLNDPTTYLHPQRGV